MSPEIIKQINQLTAANKKFLILVDYLQQTVELFTAQQLISQKIQASFFSQELGFIPVKNNNYHRVKDKPPQLILQINDPQIISYLQDRKLENIPSSYRQSFDYIQNQLHLGNSYLVNLTRASQIKLNIPLQQVYQLAVANYKVYYPKKFCCFSPESFIHISKNTINTFPMKGTITVTQNKQLNDKKNQLIQNPKENSEHHTVVDLLRNDLSIKGSNTQVNKFKDLQQIQKNDGSYLLQLTSHISAQLQQNWYLQLGDILASVLPAGSITGAPKQQTQKIIAHAEKFPRGYYSGIVGWYDPGITTINGTTTINPTFDSGVMIRFISQYKQQYYFHSGGGITLLSDLESEWQELIDKIYIPIN